MQPAPGGFVTRLPSVFILRLHKSINFKLEEKDGLLIELAPFCPAPVSPVGTREKYRGIELIKIFIRASFIKLIPLISCDTSGITARSRNLAHCSPLHLQRAAPLRP